MSDTPSLPGDFPVFGSIFSGSGGGELGLELAGWKCAWQIEIDAFRQKVLAYHWPDIPRFGKVEEVDSGELCPVDLIIGGFPCQDLSVAGKRKGLAGERSSLFWEFMRLVVALKPR